MNSHVFAAALLIAAAPAAAQQMPSEVRDGVRYLTPTASNGDRLAMQERAIDLGLFSWPVPTRKINSEGDGLVPYQCAQQDAGYVPAHDVPKNVDLEVQDRARARAMIFERLAYENAIRAESCACEDLQASWDEAVAMTDEIISGIEKSLTYTYFPGRLRDTIKLDYGGMCDVRLQLRLD